MVKTAPPSRRVTSPMGSDLVDGVARTPPAIRVLHSPGPSPRGVRLLADEELRIGRDGEPGDLVLGDPSVSRLHASVVRSGDEWLVIDRDSSNGVFVNGRRSTQAPLHPGDVIRLRDSVMVVCRAPWPDDGDSDLG